MKILGIVAEYDPFHRGHEQHLALARKMVSPSAVYIALSPCFRQRGDISLLSPYVRARCALACGADAVFSLPVFQVLNDGLQYAAHAVRLLHALGCTHLAFGAETADPDLLQKTASLLEDPPDALLLELRNGLNRGLGYPEAQGAALRSVFPEGEAILSHPNNILAVAYLRAIRKMNLRMIPVPIPRSGNDRSDTIDPENPSASAIPGFPRSAGRKFNALSCSIRFRTKGSWTSFFYPASAPCPPRKPVACRTCQKDWKTVCCRKRSASPPAQSCWTGFPPDAIPVPASIACAPPRCWVYMLPPMTNPFLKPCSWGCAESRRSQPPGRIFRSRFFPLCRKANIRPCGRRM